MSDDHAIPMLLVRGRYTHYTVGDKWFTQTDVGEAVEGFVPDPDYEEPKVTIDGRAAPVGVRRELYHFKVMHSGWECDEDGWVVEMDDGSRRLVLMNHMRLYLADVAELGEKVEEYEAALTGARKALEMLRDSDTRPKDGDAQQGSTRE